MNKDNLIFISGIAVSIFVISISGFLYYKSTTILKVASGVQVVATIVPQATVKPSEVSYKDKEIQVLNGSGISGAAKKIVSDLTAIGYTKVTAGNYKETVTGNLLFAPTDFGKAINLKDYKFEKSDTIRIVIGR